MIEICDQDFDSRISSADCSVGDDAAILILPGFAVDCTTARHIPLKALQRGVL
jgi:hypothetical protein